MSEQKLLSESPAYESSRKLRCLGCGLPVATIGLVIIPFESMCAKCLRLSETEFTPGQRALIKEVVEALRLALQESSSRRFLPSNEGFSEDVISAYEHALVVALAALAKGDRRS